MYLGTDFFRDSSGRIDWFRLIANLTATAELGGGISSSDGFGLP
jgi:hypothetical protein